MQQIVGQLVHGEITSADASGSVATVLYDSAGNVVTLGASQTLQITDVAITGGAALTVTLYGGTGSTPAAGERVLTAGVSTSAPSVVADLSMPFSVRRGVTPKVVASAAGAVTVTFQALIV